MNGWAIFGEGLAGSPAGLAIFDHGTLQNGRNPRKTLRENGLIVVRRPKNSGGTRQLREGTGKSSGGKRQNIRGNG
jgi:hypothetical protein